VTLEVGDDQTIALSALGTKPALASDTHPRHDRRNVSLGSAGGIAFHQVRQDTLRSNIGMVTQDTSLLHRSVAREAAE
jgi:hypothetical protein